MQCERRSKTETATLMKIRFRLSKVGTRLPGSARMRQKAANMPFKQNATAQTYEGEGDVAMVEVNETGTAAKRWR